MKLYKVILVAGILVSSLAAQLTPAQREQDFITLASVFSKRYAPANWKIQALNVNIFHISPWLAKVRAARTDLEFLDICAQYVASFEDGHTQFIGPGNLLADLGFYVDVYDGKLLIDTIDRSLLPAESYPFQNGDELITIDGRPAMEVVDEFSRLHQYANPSYTRRIAADALTYRRQTDIPSTGLLGAAAKVQIRRESGAVEDYTIDWLKEGTPITRFAPMPAFFDHEVARGRKSELTPPEDGSTEIPLWQQVHERFKRWTMRPENDPMLRGTKTDPETGETHSRRYYTGYGATRPVWALPPGFVMRQGRFGSDYFFTGTYQSEGKRIGYLRIGAFNTLTAGQTQILDTEINFMNNNTDGLVVDVMRNPGGSCSLATIAQRLIPKRFTHFSEQLRPTFELISLYDDTIVLLETLGASADLVENYRFERKLLLDAWSDGRGLTGPISACFFDLEVNPTANAYRKPMVLLVDDFSTSAADVFAGVMQDNERAKLIGTRTSGAGGRVEYLSAGLYSEASTTNTASLVLRAKEYEYPGFPKSPFIENVGVRPDVELDYMTKANLLQRGAPFVEAFTKIMVEEINKSNP